MSYGSVNSTAGNRATEAASSHADENSSRNVEQGQEPMTAWYRIKTFYHDNIGLFFVFLAQVFAAVVSPSYLFFWGHLWFFGLTYLRARCPS